MRQATHFHHLQVRGIIDRDRRQNEEITNLERDGIAVLKVAEVENLFCVPEVLNLVARHQNLAVDETVERAKQFVLRELQSELETQISRHVANEIKFRLNIFDDKKRGATALKAELDLRAGGIDVAAIYIELQTQFQEVIQNQDYVSALRLFNRKGLAMQLSKIFGITNLPQFVLRMVQSAEPAEWIHAFKDYVPDLSE